VFADTGTPKLGMDSQPAWLHEGDGEYLTKDDSEKLLHTKGKVSGTFLVRRLKPKAKPKANEPTYALVVMWLSKVIQIQIQVGDDGAIKLDNKIVGKLDGSHKRCETISELVTYLSNNAFPNDDAKKWKVQLASGVKHDGGLTESKWSTPAGGSQSKSEALKTRISKKPLPDIATTTLESRVLSRDREANGCPYCDVALPFVPCTHNHNPGKKPKIKFVEEEKLYNTKPKQGYAVKFNALQDYDAHKGEEGFLTFKKDTTIFVWNESGEDLPLEKEDAEGNLWLDGWIGHGSEKGIYHNDEGFGEGIAGFAAGIFPASMVGPPPDENYVDVGDYNVEC